MVPKPYPKPGPVGGRLIREMIGFLRSQGIELPITSHILIAVSGGPDSMALAHLMIKYGRRVADPKKIKLIHVDHGWRKESAKDARFVGKFAKKWNLPLEIKKLKAPAKNSDYEGRSWEEVAREARKEFFQKTSQKKKAIVLTAHQADDLAETLLWRLFTGAVSTHGGGIVAKHGSELRPFLTQRKVTLMAYLKEEGQPWLTDGTNEDERFLRARIRGELMPVIEKIFPRAVEHLVQLGLKAQTQAGEREIGPELLFQAAGVRGRRTHWEALQSGCEKMDLPDGWKLVRHRSSEGANENTSEGIDRWTLERKTETISRRNGR